jgi:hypothetical protein
MYTEKGSSGELILTKVRTADRVFYDIGLCVSTAALVMYLLCRRSGESVTVCTCTGKSELANSQPADDNKEVMRTKNARCGLCGDPCLTLSQPEDDMYGRYTHSHLLLSPTPIYVLCSFQVHWRVFLDES